jgi:[ribosomal protein S5]-alanine N-acetyltransferase
MPKPLVTTPRLVIRPLQLTDLADFHAYRSHPEVVRYQGFDVMNLAEAENFIREQANVPFGQPGEWGQHGIALKASGQLVGDCALKLDHAAPRQAEVGITISHLAQHHGYATEALSGLLTHLFGPLQLHRVVAITDAENQASARLLERCGFRREGHLVENIFFKGQWASEYLYAMLRREWEARQPAPIPFRPAASYRTARLLLTRLDLPDAEFMAQLVNSPGWLQFIGNRHVHTPEAATAYVQRIIDNPAINYWVVRHSVTATPLGIVSLMQRAHLPHPDLGFAFLPGHTGHGYAHEAAQAVLADLARQPGPTQLLAITKPDNLTSIRLLEKLGLRYQRAIEENGEKLWVYAASVGGVG